MSKPLVDFLRSESSSFHRKIDLNRELVNHPVSTFFFRAGQSIQGAPDINKDDVLIVDRSWNLVPGNKVIFSNSDNLYFGQLFKQDGRLYVKRGNKIWEVNNEVEIWGAVTYVIHKV